VQSAINYSKRKDDGGSLLSKIGLRFNYSSWGHFKHLKWYFYSSFINGDFKLL